VEPVHQLTNVVIREALAGRVQRLAILHLAPELAREVGDLARAAHTLQLLVRLVLGLARLARVVVLNVVVVWPHGQLTFRLARVVVLHVVVVRPHGQLALWLARVFVLHVVIVWHGQLRFRVVCHFSGDSILVEHCALPNWNSGV